MLIFISSLLICYMSEQIFGMFSVWNGLASYSHTCHLHLPPYFSQISLSVILPILTFRLYPLVVTSTVVSFAFFCIFTLKFPFYQWMKWLDSRSNDLSRHAWRGGSINMRIGEEGTRAFIITWGHTHKSATSRKVSPGLKNDNFSNPSGAHKINLKSCYQKIFT